MDEQAQLPVVCGYARVLVYRTLRKYRIHGELLMEQYEEAVSSSISAGEYEQVYELVQTLHTKLTANNLWLNHLRRVLGLPVNNFEGNGHEQQISRT